MEYKATGKVIKVGDIQTFESGFKKMEYVIEVTDNGYTNNIQFEVVKDKADKAIEGINVGDTVTASFNIRSNESNGRYFTNLTCWRWNVDEKAAPAPLDSDEEVIF